MVGSELVRRQSSIYDSYHHQSGCMMGVLHFFDFYRQLHDRHMLSYRRHEGGDGRRAAGRVKLPKLKRNAPSVVTEQDLLDTETNPLVEGKVNATKRNSGKDLMTTLISKLYKKNRKKKISPLAAQLLRTVSIHHLESNDYVLPEEITSDSETSIVETDSHATDSSVSSEDVILVPRGSSGSVTDERRPEDMDHAETCLSIELLDSPRKLKDQRDPGTVLNRFKALKQRVKDVIRENRTAGHQISMDGFLHKIPYGHKVPVVADSENLKLMDGLASDRYDIDSLRSKFGSDGSVLANRMYSHRSIQRSRSLAESLDKYARLIGSMPVRESRKPLQRLKSVQEHNRKSPSPKTWGRMLSTPDFRSYDFSKNLYNELSDAPGSPKIPALNLQVNDAAVGTDVSDDPKSLMVVHIEDNLEADTHLGTDGTCTDQKVVIDEHEQNEQCKNPNHSSADGSSYIPLHNQEVIIQTGSHEIIMRPTPSFDLDSSCIEEPVSPMKSSVTEGFDLKPGWTVFEKLDSPADDTSDAAEIVKADFEKVQTPINLKYFDPISIQLDQKDEPVLKYVRNILMKYGTGGEDFLEACYSTYGGAIDALLSWEADSSSYELNMGTDELEDMPIDHQLLFDLVNEMLLDILESSLSHGPSFSSFGCHPRLKPMGNYLPEVWAKISCHLSFQRHLNRTLDDIVTRDFTKYDGWMNLQWDTDYVGLELEAMILDNLLHEVMLDF